MTLPNEPSLQKLQFYVTTPYPCGYLDKKLAQSLIASPQNLVDGRVYSGLIQQGFRRSGKFAYRPHCEQCQACIPVRIRLDDFQPSRNQRRVFNKHQYLTANVIPIGFDLEHFKLYQEYQQHRHPESIAYDGGDQNDADQYRQFLCQSNVESVMVEFFDEAKTLKIVSVVDIVQDGVSAVYTFYDTQDAQTSYGTFAVLWLAQWTKSLGLPYLYLGYWIRESKKMAYKSRFKVQEHLIDGEWIETK